MQIVHIFGSDAGPQEGEGLWAVKYDQKDGHAFREFFDRMNNPQWVSNFCLTNLGDIQTKFGYPITMEEAALQLMKEARALKAKIVTYAKGGIPGKTLQEIFKPLHNSESNLVELQLSKGSDKSTTFNPKVRMYAVRFSPMTYIVTGGAIKLTHFMKERAHTENELNKMERVRTWLKDLGVYFPQDLVDLP